MDVQFFRIAPHLPTDKLARAKGDDRRMISGATRWRKRRQSRKAAYPTIGKTSPPSCTRRIATRAGK
jgi:hypothetical protein